MGGWIPTIASEDRGLTWGKATLPPLLNGTPRLFFDLIFVHAQKRSVGSHQIQGEILHLASFGIIRRVKAKKSLYRIDKKAKKCLYRAFLIFITSNYLEAVN